MGGNIYEWDIIIPAQRYVFAVHDGRIVEFNQPSDESATRFTRYQQIKPTHPVHGMIAWPNTVLLRGPINVLIDPGMVTQGPPVLLALEQRGIDPDNIDLVINTHHHVDHTHANVYFSGCTCAIHQIEYENYTAEFRLGYEPPSMRLLKGREGEIAPGLRFLLTPGHTDGSICVIARVPEGHMVIAGDTVGPLPSYFEHMKLPKGFPNRDDLMESWGRIHMERPDIIVPGHNPPVIPSYSPLASQVEA